MFRLSDGIASTAVRCTGHELARRGTEGEFAAIVPTATFRTLHLQRKAPRAESCRSLRFAQMAAQRTFRAFAAPFTKVRCPLFFRVD